MSSDDTTSAPLGQAAQGVQRYMATLLQGLKFRGELLSVEWQEEKQRLFRLVLGAVVAAMSASMAVVSINVLILVMFWDSYRMQVVVGFCFFYALLALVVGFSIRRQIREAQVPFQATFDELKKDGERLLSRKESDA